MANDDTPKGTPARKSVIPQSDEIRLPNGQVRRDPTEYNHPSGDSPTEFLDPVSVPGEAEDTEVPADAVDQPELRLEPPVGAQAPANSTGDKGVKLPWWAWTAIGVVAAAVIILILMLVLNKDGDTPLASPSPSEPPTESASPSPTADAASPFGLLDDGIAEDEYPPQAAGRTGALPAAYAMEDWVWDRVGPMWSLASYGDTDAVVDLVSPEGAHFELVRPVLPPNTQGLQVKTWQEVSRTARVTLSEAETYSQGGYLLDLTTGALDPTSFSFGSASSVSEDLVGSTASGVELWEAYDADWNSRLYRWTPDGDWQRVLPQNDYFGSGSSTTSPSGDQAIFTIHDKYASGHASVRSGEPGRNNFLLYDLGSNSSSVIVPVYVDEYYYCAFHGWLDEGSFVTNCSDDFGTHGLAFATHGAGLGTTTLDVAWSESGEPLAVDDSGLIFSGDRSTSMIYEVAVETSDGPVTVLKAGDNFAHGGAQYLTVRHLGDGVYRVNVATGSFLVDTVNAVATVPVYPNEDIAVGIAGFGEAHLGSAFYDFE